VYLVGLHILQNSIIITQGIWVVLIMKSGLL
jgi:hypothetical protein